MPLSYVAQAQLTTGGLLQVSMAEVVAALGARVRFGQAALERVPMSSMLVATLHMEQLLLKVR